MYCPDAFTEDRPQLLAALIRAHPLGLLITAGTEGPQANAVPFDLTPDGRQLRAHLARANPQLDDLRAGTPALVVFQGEHSYITPALYPDKATTGKVVPTWNYLMVQARGPMHVTDDATWLRDQIDALTTRMEAPAPAPWAVSDAPDPYIAAMLRGITGIEMTLTDLRGKWKAGQNRPPADRQSLAHALAPTHPALAAATGAP